ncbi:unnamed protein product [Urochloa humidicola]
MAYKLNCMATPDVVEPAEQAEPCGSGNRSASTIRTRSTAAGTSSRIPASATPRRRGKAVPPRDFMSDESDDSEPSADS